MVFEFDPTKSKTNKEKHGIYFIDAQAIWDGEIVEIRSSASPEDRWVVIGLIHLKCWTAVITYRNTNIRIISARRSRYDKEMLYKRL